MKRIDSRFRAPSGADLPLAPRYDVAIVGARAAGASLAMLLARAGLRVLAIDRNREGSDTLSTHALMRGAVLQLTRWGLRPALEAAGTPPIRTTTFHYGEETVVIPIQSRHGVDSLLAPRRTVMDPLLVAGARAAGAEVRHGLRAIDLLRDRSGRVSGLVIEGPGIGPSPVIADRVVGADGIHSTVARLTGAGLRHEFAHSAATLYRYVPGLDLEGYHWDYRPGVSGGAIPTNGGLTCVFVGIPAPRYQRERPAGLEPMFARALADAAPELEARLPRRGASPLHTFAGHPGFLRHAHGLGWALVGDAGAFRDPMTSHGITDALRDAEWLADAILTGSERALAGYETARDDVMLEFVRITDTIASFEWTLDELRELHLELSRRMRHGVETMRRNSWSHVPERAAEPAA
jgi:flavin-dependent dehydrogenase